MTRRWKSRLAGLAATAAMVLLGVSLSYGAGSWQILATGKLLLPGSITVTIVGPNTAYPSIQLSVTEGRLHFTERLRAHSGAYSTQIQLVAVGPLTLTARSPQGTLLARRTLQVKASNGAVVSRYGLAAVFILILVWMWRRNRRQLARYNDPHDPRD